ncbi:DUF2117 family protein [Methanotorris igneus]|uniref:Uncharacterized conserved protein UCP006598 n=1 Tax=Methanotorris igneus (strain DSM 5666 / JCM 11834 / Kol 5) TaxID=880724 RepID=F6BED6_METIK|nr:DUF2117 domain-containing protein [Methanotorris igneus]AEF95597.1 Uncharacterized conserved protein UCP006598 [Methanotorris igneus Kol 5]
MRIGVVVHGPEIVDSGYAKKIIDLLKNFGDVKAKLGGTMGRVAVIDNNLQDIIDISEKLVPSQSLKKLADNDILVLMNYGKSKETGHTFGRIVVGRANISKPIIQIERPGEKDGTIIVWNNNNSEEVKKIVDFLSKTLNLKVENCISDGLSVWKEGKRLFRKVHGVDKGEAIMVNGIVVGRAKGKEVVIVAEDGKIVDIINGEMKEHGVEKLGRVDLEKAIIKTGLLRRHPTNPNVRVLENKRGDVVFINHAGEDVLEKIKNKEISAVITIGDDTTMICGDILARFGIRIIGITDGDRDEILKSPVIAEGSAIFLIENMRDDDVGELLMKEFEKREIRGITFNECLKIVEGILNENKVRYSLQKIEKCIL